MAANIFDFKGGRVHFIGVGGSSMSGLAGYLQETGFTVTGSDRTKSHKTEHLEARGIPVNIGHDAASVHGADSRSCAISSLFITCMARALSVGQSGK